MHSYRRLPKFVRRPLTLIIGIILLVVLAPFMFALGLIAGIGFLFSCALALYKGVLWRDMRAVIFIALGYAITSYAFHLLWPIAADSWRQRSLFTTLLVAAVFLIIWLRSRRLKAGKQ